MKLLRRAMCSTPHISRHTIGRRTMRQGAMNQLFIEPLHIADVLARQIGRTAGCGEFPSLWLNAGSLTGRVHERAGDGARVT
jgi:hypothetical protein